MLIIRGVNVYPSQVEAVLVGRPGLSPHYQLVVTRDRHVDHLRIEVEAEPGLPPERFGVLAADAAHHVKSLIGVSTEVVVQPPGRLPRSQGKAQRVRDLRPKEA
jgi:phenylacetate-CoA ligase